MPVPQINFDADAAKKTFAAGCHGSRFFLDIMKLEIFRDFFQFLGIMVDGIIPAVSRVYRLIASFFNASFSYVFAKVDAVKPVHWYFIFFFVAIIPWCILLFKMGKDLNLDTKFAATRKAKKMLSWEYRNRKNPWEGKFIKGLILICTTLYSPVTRNSLQMVLRANKYFAATYKCPETDVQFESSPSLSQIKSVAAYRCQIKI